MSHVIYVHQHNHFDPTWRRCWQRNFDYRGKRYVSYSDLEERYFELWLENAKRGGVFVEGQAVIIREFLRRNPDRLEEMRGLVKSGLLDLTAAGETVPDTNMPSGETLLRNLVMGQSYFEGIFGVIPSTGWLEDAFGQSAQMPQLFRGVECNTIAALSRVQVPGEYWRGLDGSVVFIGIPEAAWVGSFLKESPCEDCTGIGCDKCSGRGFLDAVKCNDQELVDAIDKADPAKPLTIVDIGAEEATPNPHFPEAVAAKREESGLDIRMGGYRDMTRDYYAEAISRIESSDIDVCEQVEANPIYTGCYISRIRIKQRFRRLENLLNSAERWATVSYLMGADYPTEDLTAAWRYLLFCAFHDSITGTTVDQAFIELMDMLDEAETVTDSVLNGALQHIEGRIATVPGKASLVVYNSESWERRDPVTVTLPDCIGVPQLKDSGGTAIPVLDAQAHGTELSLTFLPPATPPLGYTLVEVGQVQPLNRGLTTSGPGEIENEFFRIRVSEKGIESIFDKRAGSEVVDTQAYRANELILEDDHGNPWFTSVPPAFAERLSAHTTRVTIRKSDKSSEVVLSGRYKGDDEGTYILSWTQTIKLYEGVDRIDFRASVDWDTKHRRIMVAFPTCIKTDEATYSVPYGAVKRERYEINIHQEQGKNGDWPAINWVDVHDESTNRGVALINTGTPAHKVQDGVILMSLLRSPDEGWCLDQPEWFDDADHDGARDAGHHEFFYSLVPHQGNYVAAGIEKRGREINNPLACRPMTRSGNGELGASHSFIRMESTDNVIVTAIKKADRDDSVIVRLAETGGLPGDASVSIEGRNGKASLVSFLERHPEPVSGKIDLGSFKIVTMKLET